MSKDNGNIDIDKRVQELITAKLIQIQKLQGELKEILSAVYWQSKKEGNYQLNRDSTMLELIKDKE